MAILRFNSKEEYREWLSWRSFYVNAKAKAFAERYGEDVLPVVITTDVDETFGDYGGTVYVFIHPDHYDEVLKYAIF